MEGSSVGERLDPNWNRASLVQISTAREVSAIQSGLFEQILAAPPQTVPEPAAQVDLESETDARGVSESPDSPASSDEEQKSQQTSENESEQEETAAIDQPVVPQVVVPESNNSEISPADTSDAEAAKTIAPSSEDESQGLRENKQESFEDGESATTEPSVELEVGGETAEVDGRIEQEQTLAPDHIDTSAKRRKDGSPEEPTIQSAEQIQIDDNVQLDQEEGRRDQHAESDEQVLEVNPRNSSEESRELRDTQDTDTKQLKWYEPSATDRSQADTRQNARPAEQALDANPSNAEPQPAAQPGSAEPVLTETDNSHTAVAGAATQVSHSETNTAPATSKAGVESTSSVESAKRPNTAPPERGAGTTSKKATQGDNVEQLDQQQQIRLIQRIARSFNRLTSEGGVVNLKLHPPQLGSLNVQVRLEGRDMAAKLTTETVAAREAIIENLSVLRNRLSEQGFEISAFQVDVSGGQTDSNSQGKPSHWTFDQGEQSGFGHESHRDNSRRNSILGASESQSETTGTTTANWYSGTSIDVHA